MEAPREIFWTSNLNSQVFTDGHGTSPVSRVYPVSSRRVYSPGCFSWSAAATLKLFTSPCFVTPWAVAIPSRDVLLCSFFLAFRLIELNYFEKFPDENVLPYIFCMEIAEIILEEFGKLILLTILHVAAISIISVIEYDWISLKPALGRPRAVLCPLRKSWRDKAKLWRRLFYTSYQTCLDAMLLLATIMFTILLRQCDIVKLNKVHADSYNPALDVQT